MVHYVFQCLYHLLSWTKFLEFPLHILPVSCHTGTKVWDPAQSRAVDWRTHCLTDQVLLGIRIILFPRAPDPKMLRKWGCSGKDDQVHSPYGLVPPVLCSKCQEGNGNEWALRTCSVLWLFCQNKHARIWPHRLAKARILLLYQLSSELFLPQHSICPLRWDVYWAACVRIKYNSVC